MEFSASAPCKAILFGEHYVVYGASALSIPIEPRNTVLFSDYSGEGAILSSSLGEASLSKGCDFSGEGRLSVFAAVAKQVAGQDQLPSFRAEFCPGISFKGVGVSASLSAAFAAGLYRLMGKRASREKIFLAAQSGDIVAHQGKASGIDARTVTEGKPLLFRRSFSPPKFFSRPAKFSLPEGSELLLIDTFSGKKDSTAAMLAAFARSFGISSLPQDTEAEKRWEVQKEFAPILSRALAAKTPSELGKAMNDNHILLRMRGVSSGSIEKAVAAALSHGSYGAKLTGGGGEGGSVLALCKKGGCGTVSRLVADQTGFACQKVEIASKGAQAN